MLTSLIQSLSVKMTENSSKKTVATDVNNNASQTASNVSSTPQLSATGELIGRVNMQISEDLSEFRQKTQMCREKLSQQRQMIQSLLNKISMSSSRPSSTLTSTQSAAQIKSPPTREGREDHSVSSNSETSTTSSCTTSSSSSFQAQLAARANNTDYKHVSMFLKHPNRLNIILIEFLTITDRRNLHVSEMSNSSGL